jgi:hypothetical protein
MVFRSSLPAVCLALVVTACGGSAGSTTATTATPGTTAATTTAPPTTQATTTAAPTTTAPPTTAAATAPDSTHQNTIVAGYKFGNHQGEATDEDLPFALGSVTGHVFDGGDFYVIVYKGLDLDETGPLCPGNSILTEADFEFVSNSPTPGASCEGAPNIAPDAVLLCDGQVSYVTQIPSGTQGSVFMSIEVFAADGNNVGASVAVPVFEALPDIDVATLTC